MGHWTSMFNGLARSLSIKKVKNLVNNNEDVGRNAAETLAKDAKKNEMILTSCGTLNVQSSNNFASVFMKRGQKGINQDCSIVWEEFGGQTDMIFCGVFDGHGPWGHYVAKTVRETMPRYLLCNWQENVAQMVVDPDYDLGVDQKLKWLNIWTQPYLKTFAQIDEVLEKHNQIDAFYSGTTALSVVRQGEGIIIANVGDSRAVLGTTSEEGDLVAVQLTVDFKPDLPHEVERITQCNGRVFCSDDEPGTHRVWRPDEEVPGLAMSRALGDFCIKDFGLISVPEVTHRNITTKDQFIVLATDGVWDVVSNQEAVDIISTTPNRTKAAKRLVDHSVQAWKRKRRGYAIDDISAICLFFHSSTSSSYSHHKVDKIQPASLVRSNSKN